MQEEVTQKTIAFSIKSAKLTIQVLQAAARKFLETQNKGKTKLHHGQQSLKQLKKHGAALSNIEITDANIGLFKPCAKKYGVDFTLRKDATTQPPHYMGVFDATQQVVNQSAGVIIGDTSIDFDTLLPDLESRLEAMDIGPLLGLWFQTLVVGLTMNILSICIFLVTYGRMIEIYAVTALGPIPLATLGNAEWRGMGQNYLKSLLALGFQAFLIMVVVGIYAVLIQQIGTADDISGAIWGCMGYTVLLCFCLFKTGSISKAVFTAH